ncbi:TPA: GNAT family N-acetyltransferase [Bacillus paranthracis]
MPMNLDEITFERLTPQHDVAVFSCDEEDLDHYLTSDKTLMYQEKGLGTTTLALHQGHIIGFYETRCAEIEIDESMAAQLGINYITFLSVIEISLLGVHKDFHKQGLGTLMLENLLDDAIDAKEWLGFSHLLVKSKPKAISWYEKQGFVKTNLETYDGLTHMRLPVPDKLTVEKGIF